MAWFRNHYRCARCGSTWQDEWSAMCEDDCADCGARHMAPRASEDLTKVVEQDGTEFVVLCSPERAEYDPEYREIGRFRTHRDAEAFRSA